MKKKIDRAEVAHIARLSKLKFGEEALADMAKHLDTVLGYFEMLDSMDTSAVSPTAHILDKVNVLREDKKTEAPFPREELLQNAPERNEVSYIVPRVVE